jgi:hypothetical protein
LDELAQRPNGATKFLKGHFVLNLQYGVHECEKDKKSQYSTKLGTARERYGDNYHTTHTAALEWKSYLDLAEILPSRIYLREVLVKIA